MQAKADALRWVMERTVCQSPNGDGRTSIATIEADGEWHEWFAWSLARDVLALTPKERDAAPVPAPSPDAALLAIAAEFVERDTFITSPAYKLDGPAEGVSQAAHARWWSIVDQVTARPPAPRPAAQRRRQSCWRWCATAATKAHPMERGRGR